MDYLSGRIDVLYGNPLGKFETLIPMGNGIYARYTAWCICEVDPASGSIDLLSETELSISVKTFFGADDLGFTVFSEGGALYFVTRALDAARVLK